MRKFKKLLVAALAATMVLSSMVISAFAADEYKCGVEGQFNKDIEGNFAEWEDLTGYQSTFKADGSVQTYKADFGKKVQFSGNYVGFQTNVPVTLDADKKVTNVAKLISVKLDGVEVPVADTYLTAEGYDGGLRLNLTNQWNKDITTQPVAADAWNKQFQTIEVQFSVGEAAADTGAGDSSATVLILVAVAALAVVATVSVKKFACER